MKMKRKEKVIRILSFRIKLRNRVRLNSDVKKEIEIIVNHE